MPTINRESFSRTIVQSVKDFKNNAFNGDVPENLMLEAIENIVSGFCKSLEIANGKKPAGEIRTYVLNQIRNELNINLIQNQIDQTNEWDVAAYDTYMNYYDARLLRQNLFIGASKLMRKLPYTKLIPEGMPIIHYKPEKELVERFYSKINAIDENLILEPTYDEKTRFLIGINGDSIWCEGIFDYASIEHYRSGQIEKIPKITS